MPSTLRRFGPEIGLVVFIVLNLWAVSLAQVGQTVPFHFIWISLTIVYGYRSWRTSWTLVVLGAVCLLTGFQLLGDVYRDGLDPAELTEVPLMAAVFLAMMWHSQRRQAALAQVRRFAGEQERLRNGERNFLRDASHLLRTPVTIARGYTELLRAGTDDPAVHQDTDVILRELDSISRISSRLLLLTATELGELLDCSRIDVADLVAQAGRRWRPAAERQWQVASEECLVVGDPSLLESALDALLENALRHTEVGGTITVRCSRHGDDVIIDVCDDGTGISAALLPDLFERRWQPSTPGERSGTGLGLAIVKAIVTAHGGDVRASNSAAGGAEFTLRLPAAPRTTSRRAPLTRNLTEI